MGKPLSKLAQWVRDAEPGDSMIYCIGTHARGDVSREAMDLCDAGLVALVRKRVPDTHTFEYIAQRTKQKVER